MCHVRGTIYIELDARQIVTTQNQEKILHLVKKIPLHKL